MARINTLTNFLTDVANAIRHKTGKSQAIACENFDTEIESISSEAELQTKNVSITSNGSVVITPDTGYDGMERVNVTTNVPMPSAPTKGFVIDTWDNDGYATKVSSVGFTNLPQYSFNKIIGGLFGQKLTTIDVSSCDVIYGRAFEDNQTMENVILPANLTRIYGYTFKGCSNLKNINFNNVTTIDCHAFNSCSNLALTELPNTITTIGSNQIAPNSTTNMTGQSFYQCTKLALTKLPDNLTSLQGGFNFYYCIALKISKLPDGLTTVDSNATYNFGYCRGITKMDTNNLRNLSPYFFGYCSNLVSVVMPNVTTIMGSSNGAGSFVSCTSLKAVWIGSNVNSIGRFVFTNCTKLIKIYIDLPRASVEALANYQYAFCNDANKVGIIIANDDNNFLTKTQFEETDWENYTE